MKETPARDRKQLYGKSVDRAMEWICSHQQSDGGFGEVVSMSHYMAMGASLLFCGRATEAARLMPFLKREYVTDDGNFNMPEIRQGKPGALQECRYAPSWMIYSTHMNGAFDISLRAISHVLEFQDAASGGFFGLREHAETGKGIINASVTFVGGQAALVTGHIAEARRAADHFTDNLLAQNPDLNRTLYPIWDTECGLRTDDEAPAAPNMPRAIERDKPHQHHFLTGGMMALLIDVFRATQERKYLDAAITLYEFAAGGTPALYESTASHKFAWGCAWLYRETGSAAHLESACRLCDYLLTTQDPDGSFVHAAFTKSADWPYSPRLNITAQFALWISRVAELL